MRLIVDSYSYYMQIWKSDPSLPFLMLFHGFMGSGKNFSHLMGPLSEFCNPITIDLLGHGQTDPCSDPGNYSATIQARHLQSILQRISIQNLHLYGYSMGGRFAFQLLHDAPGYFRSAIIESSHCGFSDDKVRSGRKASDEILADEIEHDYESFVDKWVHLPLFESTPEEFRRSIRKIMQCQDPLSMAASLRGFGSGVMPDVCDALKGLEMPVHLIAGEKDSTYCRRMEQISQLNPNFSFESISEAGHRVYTDRPQQLVQSIDRFLQGQNS